MAKYYIDSCIWLNLFNKEQNKVENMSVWKVAEEFLKQHKGDIISSEFITTEILNKTKRENIGGIEQYASLYHYYPRRTKPK